MSKSPTLGRRADVRAGRRALHGVRDPERLRGVEFTLQRGAIVVCRDDADQRGAAPRDSTPVYALANGAPSVPTGRVFVRLAEGERAEARRADFERAGYALREVVSYAPHAAWLEAKDGGTAAALARVDGLLAMDGLHVVEPQMLTPSEKK